MRVRMSDKPVLRSGARLTLPKGREPAQSVVSRLDPHSQAPNQKKKIAVQLNDQKILEIPCLRSSNSDIFVDLPLLQVWH